MPGMTPAFKWPYPLGGDPIAEGDDTIAAFVQQLENQVYVPSNGKNAADAFDTWPLGISAMAMSDAGATAGGWPGSGVVITVRRGGGDASFQEWWGGDQAGPLQVRGRVGNSAGWAPWTAMFGAGVPYGYAAGGMSGVQTTAGQTIQVPVTFPPGRFSAYSSTPRVFLQVINTTAPQNFHLSVSNQTVTGFNVNINGNGTAVAFWYYAVQGAI